MNKIINFYYSYPLLKGVLKKSDLTPQLPKRGFVIICLSTSPPWRIWVYFKEKGFFQHPQLKVKLFPPGGNGKGGY
jgi:hypothetical protein